MLRQTAFLFSMAALILAASTPAAAITLLHEFAGGATDGQGPQAGLAQSGSTLFGTTFFGGDSNFGTVFALEIVPEPGSLILVVLGGLLAAAAYALRRYRERSLDQR